MRNRHKVFDWSNRMVGAEDPEYNLTTDDASSAAAELFMYAQELADDRRKNPRDDNRYRPHQRRGRR